ncbi:hypothetical protein GOODEAATRI_011762 [Goodea atripinnis]|uniref:Secreted protein n=1 Tax=Goodea atripinnis TaxID=208336 RepID=A0ABV0MRE7_9TELE
MPQPLLGDFFALLSLLYVSVSLVCLVTNPLEISHAFSGQNPHAGAAASLCLKEARSGFAGEAERNSLFLLSLPLSSDSPCRPFLSVLPLQLICVRRCSQRQQRSQKSLSPRQSKGHRGSWAVLLPHANHRPAGWHVGARAN